MDVSLIFYEEEALEKAKENSLPETEGTPGAAGEAVGESSTAKEVAQDSRADSDALVEATSENGPVEATGENGPVEATDENSLDGEQQEAPGGSAARLYSTILLKCDPNHFIALNEKGKASTLKHPFADMRSIKNHSDSIAIDQEPKGKNIDVKTHAAGYREVC